MMNVIGLWILFATFGVANMMYQDQSLLKTSAGEHQPFVEARGAVTQSLQYALDTARQRSEGIRQKVSSASHVPGKTADAVQHFGADVAQVLKDGSQTCLEKIGLARPEEPQSSGEKPYTEIIKEEALDVAQVLKDGSQTSLEKIGLARPEERQSSGEKSYTEIIKEEALNEYDSAKDAAGDTVKSLAYDTVRKPAKSLEDTLMGTGEWLQGGIQATDKLGQGCSSAVEEKLSTSPGFAHDKVSERVDLVGDSASGIAQSLQDNFDAGKGKASDIGRSAFEHARDFSKGQSVETSDDTHVDPSTSSYKEKIKHVSAQAAEIVRSRATESASFLPNLGQGLAYSSGDFTNNEGRVGAEGKIESKPGTFSKIIEYVKGVKHAAGNYYEGTMEKLSSSAPAAQSCNWKEKILNKASDSLSEADETVCHAKDAAVDIASTNAGKIIDGAHLSKHKLDHNLSDRSGGKSPRVLHTRDNLTQLPGDAAHIPNSRNLTHFQKLKWITAAYLLSSCRTIHLFVFSSVYGSSFWVTFLSGYVLSHSIPRQQFGFVQSRIFPAYLRLAGSGQAVCLVLFLIMHPWSQADRDENLQHLNLWAILVSTLANVFFLEPRATKAMFQKLKIEKEEARGQDGYTGSEHDGSKTRLAAIDNKLGTFHGYSSIANLVSLFGMTLHLWHLSRRLGL